LDPGAKEGFQLRVLSQNFLSIILVFFIGLALRNYFKIKRVRSVSDRARSKLDCSIHCFLSSSAPLQAYL